MDVSEEELLVSLPKRYYDETADIPAEVNLPIDLLDAAGFCLGVVDVKRGHTALHHPQRGEVPVFFGWLLPRSSCTDAPHDSMGYADDRTNQALQLESALALDAPPLRIECFDISTLHGNFTVVSMVVFTNGADKSQYRRFKIRAELDEANDFVSMTGVQSRRYSPERMASERFGSRPDLLVVDGGKPQLTAAINQLNELGLDILPAALLSDEEVLYLGITPIVLPTGSASLYLIKQVRDESHCFAITFHRGA